MTWEKERIRKILDLITVAFLGLLPCLVLTVQAPQAQPKLLLVDGFPLGPLDRGTGQSFWDYDWSFPNGSKFTVRGFLESKGFWVDVSSQILGNNPVTLTVLSGYDVVILSATYFDIPANVPYQGVFVDYVNQGGGLLFLGQADVSWVTLDDSLGFHFVTIQWWNYYVDACIVDASHPIMSGISELPKAGGVFVGWDTLIADSPLPLNTAVLARSGGSGGMYDPDNVIALIAFQYGQGKVVAGPLDGMDRPYGPTAVDGFDVISEPVIENKLLVNAINWVAMPKYELTVTSSPVVGVPFSVDGASGVTPYAGALAQGQYVLEMPETFGGYNWSHWLEDGDTSRTKTINIQGDPTWTAIYVLATPPTVPVGGEWVPIDKLQLLTPWISLISLMTVVAASFVYIRRKRK